ncbi:hypothetical protein F0919_17900 [Taibaiella lutea]|uniref:Phage tail tape measure protein n=1 Tax=Taibaiella lutea TaxID=2608001 RepID=A0A5M6CGW5_9BACT|nr:phage tail tape measure protein [Taibaiella lutea]KAA5532655.1 hypothetical protein F0919_17900 [Taibaiella lutea]
MAGEKITKIYDLQELGGEHVIATLEQINLEFAQIKRSKQALNKETIKASFDGDTEAVNKLKGQFEELRVQELQLKVQRQELINQGKQAQLIRQQELSQQKQITNGNAAVSGSYYEISQRYRELSQIAKSVIPLNDKLQVTQAQNELRVLKTQLDNFNRSLSPDGTLVGEYKTGILNAFRDAGLTDLIQNQLTQAKTKARDLNTEFEKLRTELRAVQSTGQGSLDTLERQLLENRAAAGQLNTQIVSLEQGIRGTGVGTQIVDGLKASFRDLGKQVAQVAIGYIGIQAALSGIRKETGIAKELSDQTTNLEIELGKVKGGADELVKSLADIDTRTKLTGLEEIANIAAKAGVSEENLAGVAESIDKIKIAFGKDFGDVEKGTEDLVKLINVFLGTEAVNGDNLLRTGNAVRTLANESIASVPFLNDFATRMAGLRGISDITLPSVLGLASGFEQFGQSAEVSSTALVKIIPKLATDTKKYGEIAGLTQKQFSTLLNSRPEEALLKVAEGLTKGKTGIEEISQAFADSELGKGRVTSVLGVLSKNADAFRKSIDTANVSFQNTSNIEDAFAAKNNNLSASLDKLSKAFADAANSKAFQLTLLAISSLVLLFINNLPTVISLVTLWAAGWAVANKELVLQYSRLALLNAQLLISRIALGALTIAQTAYTAVMGFFSGATNIATTATNLFRAALVSLPFGWILAIIGAVTAGFVALGTAVFASTNKLKDNYRASQLNGEIQTEVAQATAGTTAKINALTSVIKDNNISLAARKIALQQLIAIAPEYLGNLKLENIKTAEGIKVINDYVKALENKAKAQAIDNGLTKSREKLLDAQKNEARAATDPDFAKEEYRKQASNPFFSSVIDAVKFGTLNSEQAYIKYYYQQLQKEAQKDIDFFTKAIGGQIVDSAKKISDDSKNGAKQTVGELENELKDLIKSLEDSYALIALTDKNAQDSNIKQRQIYQKELDDLNAKKNGKPEKEKTYNGAKLTGETKDSLKEIETETDLLKAELEKRKTLGTISEFDYYTELNKITQDGITKKLAIIKEGNAEEKKQRAELMLQAVLAEKDKNQKLYDLGEKSAQQTLQSANRNADNKLKLVTESVNSTELQKSEAQLQYDNDALKAQIDFNVSLNTLEAKYGVKSLENAQKRWDELKKLETKILNDRLENNKKIYDTTFEAIDKGTTSSANQEDTSFANAKTELFNQQFATEEARKEAFEDLERKHQAKILQIQRASIYSKLIETEKLHTAGVINEKDYNSQVEGLNKELAENSAAISQNNLDTILDGWDDFRNALGKITSAIEAANQSILKPLFDLQKQKIENAQEQTNKEQDAQKEQELNLATSEQQKEEIEKKYDAKRAASDKKYSEEKKKIALKELAVDSALAAVRSLLSLPNYAQVAINLGLVAASYALQRAKIESTKFEKGGKLKSTLSYGGIFDGPSHVNGGIPISNKEVEGKEGYVINKNSMSSGKRMTVTGTPAQISSAANVAGGGVDFAPGATRFMYDYGGSLGMNLKAPVIMPRQYLNTAAAQDNSEVLATLKAQADAITAMSSQILTLQVQLNPNAVTNYQDKKSKAVKLATL